MNQTLTSSEHRMFIAASSLTRYLKTYGIAILSTCLLDSQTLHIVRPLLLDASTRVACTPCAVDAECGTFCVDTNNPHLLHISVT